MAVTAAQMMIVVSFPVSTATLSTTITPTSTVDIVTVKRD